MMAHTFSRLLKAKESRGAGYLVLIDPDTLADARLGSYIRSASAAGADGFLVGGSLLLTNALGEQLKTIKASTELPVVLFPGSLFQISPHADAILYLVLISGRNPDHLIGNHVVAAPILRSMKLETISTGYMLIGTGKTTSAEFMSNTKPIPNHKPDIAVAHAIAAEMMGMACLYLDAGSGADEPVSDAIIAGIRRYSALPMIIGGGIRTPEAAAQKVTAGASFVVTGTATESQDSTNTIRRFADAIHAAGGSTKRRTS
jgi:phosphoglycerol geranylgeranyltransferase